MRFRFLRYVVLLLFIILFTSCITRHIETQLAGTSWSLLSLQGQPLIEDTEITLVFKGSYLEGTMGCNGYGGGPDSGAYSVNRKGKLTFGEFFAVTVQLCSEPEGIMEQEDTYIKALRSAAAYQISNDRLMLQNALGETVLVFRID